MTDFPLVFAAVVPPIREYNIIHEIQMGLRYNYEVFAATRGPVHITILQPFNALWLTVKRIYQLKEWYARQSPFNVDLNDYGFFDNKFRPVVYLNVTRTDQLSSLHLGTRKMIIKEAPYLRGSLNASFNPHLTIGYKDISPEIFPTIKEEYSQYKFNTTFEADHITFFIHDRKQWNVLYEFPFLGIDDSLRSISKQGSLF